MPRICRELTCSACQAICSESSAMRCVLCERAFCESPELVLCSSTCFRTHFSNKHRGTSAQALAAVVGADASTFISVRTPNAKAAVALNPQARPFSTPEQDVRAKASRGGMHTCPRLTQPATPPLAVQPPAAHVPTPVQRSLFREAPSDSPAACSRPTLQPRFGRWSQQGGQPLAPLHSHSFSLPGSLIHHHPPGPCGLQRAPSSYSDADTCPALWESCISMPVLGGGLSLTSTLSDCVDSEEGPEPSRGPAGWFVPAITQLRQGSQEVATGLVQSMGRMEGAPAGPPLHNHNREQECSAELGLPSLCLPENLDLSPPAAPAPSRPHLDGACLPAHLPAAEIDQAIAGELSHDQEVALKCARFHQALAAVEAEFAAEMAAQQLLEQQQQAQQVQGPALPRPVGQKQKQQQAQQPRPSPAPRWQAGQLAASRATHTSGALVEAPSAPAPRQHQPASSFHHAYLDPGSQLPPPCWPTGRMVHYATPQAPGPRLPLNL
ncbi:hypothetical protein V8C86DRAFT_2508350 [Haematococcus lacustris]